MLEGKRVLAVVPARSGSRGIPGKNMRKVGGLSLIARAAQTLAALDLVDYRVISTDSPEYAEEGRKFGLAAPFLRPSELSTDTAGALETVQHALGQVEAESGTRYDVILVVEPTSPLRMPADLEGATRLLVESGADAVVTVSPLPGKAHPLKVLRVDNGLLTHFLPEGRSVANRQELERLYWRNGVCYALTRECLLEQQTYFGARTLPYAIEREIVNIDEPWELERARFLAGEEGLGSRNSGC